MMLARTAPAALAGVAALLTGCAGAGAAESSGTSGKAAVSAAAAPSATSGAPDSAAPASGSGAPVSTEPPAPAFDPRTEAAVLSVPAIGLEDLRVVPYEGTTDDWPGTRIQNRGAAASPYGERGGVGPGEVGNYLVTAHRLSAGGPMRDLPALDKGDSVFVTAGGSVYEYVITETRQTSFRSERSLAEQRAAVPGHPGEKPTEAMITLSTCATPEDDAAGNFWRDDKGNPEHRIDKTGVLRGVSDR
ncbi:class E sortase [Streptomyces sp. Tu 2975]|uniref:class E sortase n=1 Tax=Streptomyces sp. Tu 2975 TaxID=2676871 RepID=UPI00135C9C7D|nr:class E sortase [Streptomyces sp. Tu 2975]QIP82959.1 class E sortase [Streptomyces sp. Tu 2975]